jgi:hypothetical protein
LNLEFGIQNLEFGIRARRRDVVAHSTFLGT